MLIRIIHRIRRAWVSRAMKLFTIYRDLSTTYQYNVDMWMISVEVINTCLYNSRMTLGLSTIILVPEGFDS